jgi:molybdate transport system substrate-binding protein
VQRRSVAQGLAAAFACLLGATARACAEAPPTIAAASDLQFALSEIAEAYRKDGGGDIRLTFGSSGNVARQIRQGAPFQIFFSADEAFVDDLHRDGYVRDAGVLYGVGRLVLLLPKGSTLAADGTLADLAAAVRDGRLLRLSIANPEHAPYGQRAEEVLRNRGLWDAAKPRLVLGENVTQAAQFVTSGNASAGLVALSLALSPRVAARTDHAVVPSQWHTPLRQRMVLTRRAGAAAERFFTFCQSALARVILTKYGFATTGGTP